jgi:hypothetical protein
LQPWTVEKLESRKQKVELWERNAATFVSWRLECQWGWAWAWAWSFRPSSFLKSLKDDWY